MALHLGYLGLTLVVIFILFVIGSKTIDSTFFDKSIAKEKKVKLGVGLLLWQIYVYAMAASGVFDNFDFPPRFFLFLILPLFVFTGVFIYKNRNKAWIANIPEHWLVFYQRIKAYT